MTDMSHYVQQQVEMGRVSQIFCLGWSGIMILPVLASHTARITDVHHCTQLMNVLIFKILFSVMEKEK
jgi:hypothetical protein